MTFLELNLDFKKNYRVEDEIVFYSIIFDLSKIVKNKLDFIGNRNSLIDFKYKTYIKLIDDYFIYKKPLDHILKQTSFCGVNLKIKKGVLSPRSVTEAMTIDFINKYKNINALNIVDLCCGSGNIAIAIKKNCPQHHVVAVDKYLKPYFLARKNAKLNNVSIKVIWKNVFYFLKSQNNFDVIISNPPYVSIEDKIDNLMTKHESKRALIAKNDGLYFYQKYFEILNNKSFKEIWLEIGFNQFNKIEKIISNFKHLNICLYNKQQNYIIVKKK